MNKTRTQKEKRASYARRLSRMSREDRLMSRAIRRSREKAKPKYRDCGKVGNVHCPPEWR